MPTLPRIRVHAVVSRAAAVVLIAGGLFASTVASGEELQYISQSKQPRPISQLAQGIGLSEIAPCRLAAVKHCSRSGSISESLLRCAATLAAISDQIGNRCRKVLQRYGQL